MRKQGSNRKKRNTNYKNLEHSLKKAMYENKN